MDNLKSIWSVTDKDMFEAMKYEDRNTRQQCEKKNCTNEAIFQRSSMQKNCNAEYDSNHSDDITNSDIYELFTAIPKEFRPNKCNKDLLQITEKTKDNSSEGKRHESGKGSTSKKYNNRYFCNNTKMPKTIDELKETQDRFSTSKGNCVSKSDEIKLENKNKSKKKPNTVYDSKSNNQVKEKEHFSYRQNEFDNTHVACSTKACSKDSEGKEKSLREEFLEVYFTRSTVHSSKDLKTERQNLENNYNSLEDKLKACKFKEHGQSGEEKVIKENRIAETDITNESKKNARSCKAQGIKWKYDLCGLKRNEMKNNVSFRYVSTTENAEKSSTTAYWATLKQNTFPYERFLNKTERNKYSIRKSNSGSQHGNINVKGGNEDETENPMPDRDRSSRKSKNRTRPRRNKLTTQVIKHEIKIIHTTEPNEEKHFDVNYATNVEEKYLNSTSSSLPLNENHYNSLQECEFSKETNIKTIKSYNVNEFETNTKIAGKQLEPEKCEALSEKHSTFSLGKCTTQDTESSVSRPKYADHAAVQQYKLPSTSKTGFSDNTWNIFVDDNETKITSLIEFGNEISDIISGSHMGMNVFLSFYNEWLLSRSETISLLEKFAESVSNLSKKNGRIKDVADLMSGGANILAVVPIHGWHLAIASKAIATLTSTFSKLFRATPSLNDSGLTESEMMRHLQEDIETTSIVYMYATQCDQQFQEACNLIEKFQQRINDGVFAALSESPEYAFLQDLKGFNPKNHSVYYKRLYNFFETLKRNPTCEVSKAFCRAFEDSPEETATIKQLQWRFYAQITDNEFVERAWDDICMFLQDADSDCCKTLFQKIRNCIKALVKERCLIETNVKELMKYKD